MNFGFYVMNQKMEKWVSKNFDPLKNRIELIKICGHYILSNYDFINRIKIKFKNIDTLIVNKIINKLNKLHGYKT